MTCEELLKALNEYVDGEQPTDVCEGFAEHLAECNPCQVVVDNIRNVILLYKSGKPFEIPDEFQARLQQGLRVRWGQRSRKELNNDET